MAPPKTAHVTQFLPLGTKLVDIYKALGDPIIASVTIQCKDPKEREFFYDSLVKAFHRKATTLQSIDFRTQGNDQVVFTRKK